MRTAEATARSEAPPDVVWSVLVDAADWSRWGPWDESVLEREGEPPPNGVGAVKRLRFARRTLREEVTQFEAPARYGYRLLSGVPLRNYSAEVTLSPDGHGTRITWRSRFDSKIPGTGRLAEGQVAKVLADVATRVAREAASRHTG